MINSIIFLTLIWVLLYFYARAMYGEVIIPQTWNKRKRAFFSEVAGIFCFITAPIGFAYVTIMFFYLTGKMILESFKLVLEMRRNIKKLRRGE